MTDTQPPHLPVIVIVPHLNHLMVVEIRLVTVEDLAPLLLKTITVAPQMEVRVQEVVHPPLQSYKMEAGLPLEALIVLATKELAMLTPL